MFKWVLKRFCKRLNHLKTFLMFTGKVSCVIKVGSIISSQHAQHFRHIVDFEKPAISPTWGLGELSLKKLTEIYKNSLPYSLFTYLSLQ